MRHGIELDFEHTFTVYTDNTEQEEKELTVYVLVKGEFQSEVDGIYTDYNWTVSKSVLKEDFRDLLEFFNPELYQELEKEVQLRVSNWVEEACAEWHTEGFMTAGRIEL